MFLHYIHEKGLDSLKRDIHQIYSDIFGETQTSDIRLIIGHRNSRNINSELIKKQPHRSLIKLKQISSRILLVYIELKYFHLE